METRKQRRIKTNYTVTTSLQSFGQMIFLTPITTLISYDSSFYSFDSVISTFKWNKVESNESRNFSFSFFFFFVHCNHAKQILLRDDIDNMNSNINSISNFFHHFLSSDSSDWRLLKWGGGKRGVLSSEKREKKVFFSYFFRLQSKNTRNTIFANSI